MNTLFRLAVLTSAVALLITACGGAAATADAPTAQPAAPTTAPTATTPPPTPPPPTDTPAPPSPTPSGPLTLISTAFQAEGDIPVLHAQKPFVAQVGGFNFVCDSSAAGVENESPHLQWSNVPAGTASFSLLMVDDFSFVFPDAPPDARFPHWVVYNIPPDAVELPQGVPPLDTFDDGTLQGLNGFPAPHNVGYGGPCPPRREKHLYLFTLYALDTLIELPPGAEYEAVLAALEGHIIAEAELRAFYTGQ